MVVCKFWQKGNCRNGESCRFEHPGAGEGRQGGGNAFNVPGGNHRRNPFDALSNEGPRQSRLLDSYRPGVSHNANNQVDNRIAPRFFLDEQLIRTDLTVERPLWPFSNYAGAGDRSTDGPKQFFDSAMEQSPEEVRCQYYLAKLQGQELQAQQAETSMHQSSMAEVDRVRQNIRGAIHTIIEAKKQHPNRWDILNEVNKDWPSSQVFQPASLPLQPLGGPSNNLGFGQQQSAASGFGKPSQTGQHTAFGQPSQPSQGTPFGQPSQLGQGSTFGQPAQLGGAGGFGQPSSLGQNSNPFGSAGGGGFGQQSQLSQQANSFGQLSTTAQGSAFGRPSAIGIGAAGGFGQPSNLAGSTSGGFGQPSALGQKPNPFGQPAQATPFSPPSQPSTQSNPFGQPMQQPDSFTSPFTQRTNQAPGGGFGAGSQSQPSSGAFGTPSQVQKSSLGVGQTFPPQQLPGGFGQAAQPQGIAGHFSEPARGFGQQSNPFGQPNAGGLNLTSQKSSSFGAPQPSNGISAPALQIKTNQATRMNGAVSANARSAGPRDADPPDEMYGSKSGEFKDAYLYVLQNDAFKDGVMPEIAPQHDWVGYGQMEEKFVS